jgi:hypothetical protein
VWWHPIELRLRRTATKSFMRRFVVPEEDRHLFTARPWDGEYRWFRSPNVIPIERYRRRDVGRQA